MVKPYCESVPRPTLAGPVRGLTTPTGSVIIPMLGHFIPGYSVVLHSQAREGGTRLRVFFARPPPFIFHGAHSIEGIRVGVYLRVTPLRADRVFLSVEECWWFSTVESECIRVDKRITQRRSRNVIVPSDWFIYVHLK